MQSKGKITLSTTATASSLFQSSITDLFYILVTVAKA
jgi:hypothetical protein